MKIDNKFLKIGLIGSPVYHSKSPNIYARYFTETKMNGSFDVIDVKKEELPNIRQIVEEHELCAFAVTMPYKKEIVKYLDALHPDAEKLQSVNLVVVMGATFIGVNTDGRGFVRSLTKNGYDVNGKRALIYGYGGAASALVYFLKDIGVDISVTGRNLQKAYDFAKKMDIKCSENIDISDVDLFINATPLGMAGYENFHDFDFLRGGKPDLLVCDLVYSPQDTELLRAANKMGYKTQNGMGMLECQAEVAFLIITATITAFGNAVDLLLKGGL